MRRFVVTLSAVLAASQLGGGALALGTAGPLARLAPRRGSSPNVAAPAPITDFNGDGFIDLAVGVAGEDINSVPDAGGVNVIYGTSFGLASTGNQFWSQDSKRIKDTAEQGDQFGQGLAAGDFDNDGFTDLAAGAPFDSVGTFTAAGVVNVLYGTANGLSYVGNKLFTEDNLSSADGSEKSDLFGASLAAGDFDGDGYDDLAIGIRQEKVGTQSSAGAVAIIYGTPEGLTTTGNQFITQDELAGEGAESGDVFSRGLAAGDFDADGFADLAIGAWNEDVGGTIDAGAVNVMYGTAGGLSTAGNEYITEGADMEANAWFGKPIVTGDVNGDGFFDMVVSAHQHSVGSNSSAGQADVFLGAAAGVHTTADEVWTEDNTCGDGAESGDHFARTTAVADFDDDGFDDLAIGISDEDVGNLDGAGATTVIFGSAGGLTGSGCESWTQDSPNVKDDAEMGDSFGWFVLGGDYNGDGAADLADGVAYEDLPGSLDDAGLVNLLYGSPAGITTTNNQAWTQDHAGMKGDGAEAGDLFGVIET